MEKPILEISAYAGYVAKSDLVSSIGRESNKRLQVRTPIEDISKTVFVVIDHGKIVYEGGSFEDAAQAYNQAA